MSRLLYFIAVFLMASCSRSPGTTGHNLAGDNIAWESNLAYEWGKLVLEATANDTERFLPRPTVTSRILGLIFTAVFDAWSVYDDKAKPVYLKEVPRQPSAERTLRNKEIAISYAAYGAMKEYFFSDSLLFRAFMEKLGLDPDDRSLDPRVPAGIGNLAARAVIEARKSDGSDHYGEMPGSKGQYSNYISYKPVNTPDVNTNISRWQPKYFADGKGGRFAPECLTPHWYKVMPLVLQRADQFRPGPPPAIGSEQLDRELQELIDIQAGLTHEQKALVEFMRDGPKSVQQAGHWLQFAQEVSVRDRHTLDEDVTMYFLVEAAAMDAFIACWDAKMYYDYARPFALIHARYKDKEIRGWGGPNKGVITMLGQDWVPYSPETFVCPPFPAYVSGHSCVSGACSEVLRLFKGSDYFGSEVRLVPGIMTEPESAGDTIVLKLPTFSATADMAGISRVMGGYHIQADNIEGLKLGRKVGNYVWKTYLDRFTDTPAASR